MTKEMTANLSLNEATLQFVNLYAENVLETVEIEPHTLQELFRMSLFYNKRYDENNSLAVGKAISYALSRSDHWQRVKIGLYRNILLATEETFVELEDDIAPIEDIIIPISLPSTDFRNKLIDYLAERLFDKLKRNLHSGNYDYEKHQMSTQEISSVLYFLMESYYKEQKLPHTPYKMGDYVSEEAKQLIELKGRKKNLVFEHMVPTNLYINEFIKLTVNNELTQAFILNSLQRNYYSCIVTQQEREKLIPFVMGEGWDGQDPFYRYDEAGIRYFEQDR
ncbi:MAG TPA: hypothetical protein IAA29_09190 [Candidatus Paenibacillus intestinavium]|nr:hypothetical protein [Candidatus Paenibacillus intestinavium]